MSSLRNKHKLSSLLSPFHFDKFTRDDFIYRWKTTTLKLFNRSATWILYEDHTKEVFSHIFLQKYILLSENGHNHLLFSALSRFAFVYGEKKSIDAMRCVYIQNSSLHIQWTFFVCDFEVYQIELDTGMNFNYWKQDNLTPGAELVLSPSALVNTLCRSF